MTTNLVPRKRQATWRKFDETRRSTCGNCPAGCGVKGFVDSGTLVDLFGDEEHPANKGSFCPKGLLSWVLLGHPDRICRPRIRDSLDQDFRTCSWPEALGKIASQCVKRDGDIVLHSDENVSFGYQYGASLFARLGADVLSARIIGPGGFDTKPFGPAGRIASMFGLSADRLLMNSQRDWAFSRCILLVGADLGTTDPMTLGPLVDVRDRGGSLVVIDSKTTISAVKASYHIRVNPGTEAAFLAAVVRQLMATNAIEESYVNETVAGLDALRRKVDEFTLERTAQICGVPSSDIELISGVVGEAHPMQVMCGDWLARSRIDDELLGLSAAIVLLRGSVGIPGGGLNILGASPFEFGTDYHHLENLVFERDISALVLHGNPVARLAGGTRVRERLSQLPLVIQMGGFLDDTSSFAHVQLPLTTWVEEAGLNHRNNGRTVQWREPLTSPRDQCRPALDIWFDLIAECGLALPQFGALRGVSLAAAAAEDALKTNDLTTAINVSDLTPTINPPGGILWPSVEGKGIRFEDDRFGRGDVRGQNILFRRHRSFAGSNHRFPTGGPVIDVSGALSRSPDTYESPAALGKDDRLKMIVTVGVDFIPGWSGARPTPALKASLPVVRVHPETGLRHDLITGSPVTVSNEYGSFEGRVELSLTVGRDVLWCIETPGHGERHMTAFGLFDVPADGMPRPPFTLVAIGTDEPRRHDAFAMMLGR